MRHRVAPDPLALRIGTRVRRFRRAAKIGLPTFERLSGASRGYLSELERGLLMPTVGRLATIADALGVTLTDLVMGDSPRERLFERLRTASPAVLREVTRLLGDGAE